MKLQSPLESLIHPLFDEYSLKVDIKRDDLIHPIISGNKWRKLKYLLQDAKSKGCQTLVSMGGNYSNHLHALAFAGKNYDFKTVGFVRAHPEQALTATLTDCRAWGMELVFIGRKEYAQLRNKNHWNDFANDFQNSYWITEGGYSELAIQGISEIVQEVVKQIHEHYDFIFCGLGSGTTLAGLAKGFVNSTIIGVAAFKGADYLRSELANFISTDNWMIDTEHHCGGFAKSNQELDNLQKEFQQLNGYSIDKIYNAKVLHALYDHINQGKVKKGSKILVINTGGLQGNRA